MVKVVFTTHLIEIFVSLRKSCSVCSFLFSAHNERKKGIKKRSHAKYIWDGLASLWSLLSIQGMRKQGTHMVILHQMAAGVVDYRDHGIGLLATNKIALLTPPYW